MSEADVTFECDLEEPPEKVWRAIAEPALRDEWLGAPEVGEAVVVAADPGSRLDLVWPTRDGDTLVSFEVAPGEDGGAHLTIVHRVPARIAQVVELRPRAPARTMSAFGWRMAA